MANKKTNKKVTNKKQSSGKRNSAGSKSITNYADTIRVTEIVSVAVSVILFCLAIVSGNGVWYLRYVCRYSIAAFDNCCYSYIFS